ncbi:hypothetical protein [uncultured Nitrospira sp.]|uniref:hypothetical protein n=1 Tax=uncultured Nitrospira sp. TaxID=157176 RepID=UPI0031403BAA
MGIENIHCENSSDIRLWDNYQASLLGDLKGQVFHLTSQRTLDFIKNSGAIEHNKDGRFKLNTASEKSFGRLNGWVCFFDLRNASSELIPDILDRYDFLRPPGDLGRNSYEDRKEYELAYLVLDSKFHKHLILYEKFDEHVKNTGQYPMAVPEVETWVADRVPITWIEKIILANFGGPMTANEIQLNQIHNELFWTS